MARIAVSRRGVLLGALASAAVLAWWRARPVDAPVVDLLDPVLARLGPEGWDRTQVAAALRAERVERPSLGVTLDRAFAWLDAAARDRGGFAALAELDQDALLTAMLGAPDVAVRRAGHLLRSRVMVALYTDSRTLRGLGYDGPPQPVGFPDHVARR